MTWFPPGQWPPIPDWLWTQIERRHELDKELAYFMSLPKVVGHPHAIKMSKEDYQRWLRYCRRRDRK